MIDYTLPKCIQAVSKQMTCKLGQGILQTIDHMNILVHIGNNTLLKTDDSIPIDIVVHSASNYYELGNYESRSKDIQVYSRLMNCLYIHANPLGCDGGRLIYEGGSSIWRSGDLLVSAPRFALTSSDIAIGIASVPSLLYSNTLFPQSCASPSLPIIKVPIILGGEGSAQSPYQRLISYALHEELALSAGTWMWDYLRRSRAIGFFLPLMGTPDSAAGAVLVTLLAERLFVECRKGNLSILTELSRVMGKRDFTPLSSKDIITNILYTAYLDTTDSDKETRMIATTLAADIGNKHIEGNIDEAIGGFRRTIQTLLSSSHSDPKADQDMAARTALLMNYITAHLTSAQLKRPGFLLLLSPANSDRAITGQYTKYDITSGDLNPIGSWSQRNVNDFLEASSHKFPSLCRLVMSAVGRTLQSPHSETEETKSIKEETDLNASQLEVLAKLREEKRCGPVSMFEELLPLWTRESLKTIAEKVKAFFRTYATHRHMIPLGVLLFCSL